jgi:hypothetical protein
MSAILCDEREAEALPGVKCGARWSCGPARHDPSDAVDALFIIINCAARPDASSPHTCSGTQLIRSCNTATGPLYGLALSEWLLNWSQRRCLGSSQEHHVCITPSPSRSHSPATQCVCSCSSLLCLRAGKYDRIQRLNEVMPCRCKASLGVCAQPDP